MMLPSVSELLASLMGAQESANKRQDEVIDVDDEVPQDAAAYKLWTHIHPAVRNKKIPCTIFIKKLENNDEALKYFENGIKLLKQLKHPNILKFLEGACTTNDVSLITERVQMLDLSLKSMTIVEIQSGLRHILEALLFLHNKACLSHNNISPSSIFVCSNGEWKLGGFEFTSSPDLSIKFTRSRFYDSVRPEEFVPPDDQTSEDALQHFSLDSYGFGKLIDYTLQNFDENDEVVRSLKDVAEQLTAADLAARMPLSAVLDHPALSNDLTELISFCNTIQLKDAEDKNAFYGNIVARLRSLPGDVVARRLCRLLLSRYVLLEPKSHSELYPYLLIPAEDGEGILSREFYDSYMVPELLRLFRVRESAVRIALLSHFSLFARYLPRDRLEGFVTDEVVQGCFDCESALVSSSLRALATLVDILGAEAVCPWSIAKKFGNGSPQKARSSKTVFGIGFPRMESTSLSRTESTSGVEVGKANGLEKSASVPFINSEKEWAEVCSETSILILAMDWAYFLFLKEKADWNNDFSWSADWKDSDDPAPAESPGKAPPADSKDVPKSSKPLKLHAPISKKNSATDAKRANVIGSEFEISVMPKKSIEDDLFADLTPNIPTPTSLIDKLKALQTTTNAEPPIAGISSKFAMVETPEDTSAWDENEDISITNAADSVSTKTAQNAISDEDE
ncbi:hypothetical protein ANCCAN_07206 [Ancylostoma caninum]|uniref:Protein kinase domain-containing protein n=1 Tax=Ancylostoma caninum TaxID=29170 RepID=A0A368GR02_ANCCA|nr:hypothetical protein ANCCAN_07206 [Ancylostoma caninum]